ncbi:MAG TPA: class I SAM-dependent methyltransferase [Microbacterium sp.]|nr:class I SAM-dependent methyltransferase [Microbacterium sp.]
MTAVETRLPEQDRPVATMAGHWILAKLGKKVLRPGGRAFTRRLLDISGVTGNDVVELAPGLGHTAQEIVARAPHSYRGVDADPAAVATVNRALGTTDAVRQATADETGLDEASADLVFGEAMLTMQSDRAKKTIVDEAYRLLRPGGRYTTHELGLVPDGIEGEVKRDLQQSLARSIKVNARPLTIAEWRKLFEDSGFEVHESHTAPMRLLQPSRLVADEGLRGAARFVGNVITHPDERRRVLGMRRTFRTHRRALVAVGIVAVKPVAAIA